MSKIIFQLEDRGRNYIFHWLYYMIAGLRNLDTQKNRIPTGNGIIYSNPMEQNFQFFDPKSLKKPFNVWIPQIDENILDFQKETFDLLKNDFVLIKKNEIKDNDIVIYNWGEPILDNGFTSFESYEFIRNLFMSRITPLNKQFLNKFFIKRSKSHLLVSNSGLKRRHIVNENEICDFLKKNFDIESIFLEDFSMSEKIQMFNQAQIIIGPNTGGFSFLPFVNKSVKIVEINVKTPHQSVDQYLDICKWLNCKHEKFYADAIDNHDNMIINLEKFSTFFKI